MLPANRPAVYADLLALPDGERGEVLAGEIVVSPAALPRHARAQGALGRFIGGPYDYDGGGPGGWWILPEVDVRFAEHDILRPDLAGWRRERLLDPWGTRPIDTIPNWVCEVVSPSNAAVDRVVKRRLYARHGVGFYWIVDPEARTLEALQLRGGTWIDAGSFDESAAARVPPFLDVELDLGKVFPPRSSAE